MALCCAASRAASPRESGSTVGCCARMVGEANAIIAAALSKRARALLESSVIYERDERNCIGGGAVCLGKCAVQWSDSVEVELGQLTENFLVTLVGEKGDAGVLVAPNTVHDDNRYQHAGSDHRI